MRKRRCIEGHTLLKVVTGILPIFLFYYICNSIW